MAWERELEDFVRERGSALVGYAYLLAGDLAAAEDLVQEGLVRTWTRRRTGADVAWLEAYVRRCILHAFVDGTRRARRWREAVPLVAVAEHARDGHAAADDRSAVLGALAHLSPRQRACVVLRFYEDLPVQDIADRLQISTGGVKRYLHDANGVLAPLLGPQAGLTAEDIPTTKGRDR
ncbi:sigma-70 family RNA polymerase sigma factor [Cellulomonas sp. Marseille-Q8402]